MTTLDDVVALSRLEQYLVVVSTARADGTIQSSLVNAGVIPHPTTGDAVLALVTYGPAKLRNLRAAAPAAPGDLHRRRWHPRRLGRLRRRDGRAAPHRGPDHPDPRLQQLTTDLISGPVGR